MLTKLDVARVCHEANRAYCASIGDNSQVAWEDAEQWQKDSAIDGVEKVRRSEVKRPSDSHVAWSSEKMQKFIDWLKKTSGHASYPRSTCY